MTRSLNLSPLLVAILWAHAFIHPFNSIFLKMCYLELSTFFFAQDTLRVLMVPITHSSFFFLAVILIQWILNES